MMLFLTPGSIVIHDSFFYFLLPLLLILNIGLYYIIRGKVTKTKEKAFRIISKTRKNQHRIIKALRISEVGEYQQDTNSGLWSGSRVFHEITGIPNHKHFELEVYASVIHPEEIDQFLMDQSRNIASQKAKFSMEYRIIRASDNVVQWVRDDALFEYDFDGKPISIHGTLSLIHI